MITPDLQAPFYHRDTVDFLQAVIESEKPTMHVNIGDEVDFHAISDWDHDPNGMSAGDELEAAIKSLQPIYKLIPKTLVCTSNHTERPYRKAYKCGIPKKLIKPYREFLEAPEGWTWDDSWEIDKVIYQHGEGYGGQKGALKAALDNMQSTVIGHLHAWAGIQYSANAKHLVFGFNVGCLIDRHSYAFAYGKFLAQKPILGCGIVDRGVPKFIPMLLNQRDRWVQKVSRRSQ